MNTPKIIEKIIDNNKDEFIEKFGQEAVEEILTKKKSLKTMVEDFNLEVLIKDMIEDALTCYILEK